MSKFILKSTLPNPNSKDLEVYEYISDTPDNGRELMLSLCKKNNSVNDILYKFIGKGASIHFIPYKKYGGCSHGDHNCFDEFNLFDVEKIKKGEGYYEIIYPALELHESNPSDTIQNNIINTEYNPKDIDTIQNNKVNVEYNESISDSDINIYNKKIQILLDVDGVINMICSPEDLNKYNDSKTFDIYGGYGNAIFNIKYRTSIINTIKKWYKYADIFWLTSWRDMARYRLAPVIGLPDFPLAPFYKGNIDEKISLDKPIIWIDDELNTYYQDNANKLKQKCIEKNIKYLFVTPNPVSGLNENDINIINDFILSSASLIGISFLD